MPAPPRRRIDFRQLPAAPRYALALAVLAAVVLIVLLVRDQGSPARPAGWYTVAVRVGAVVLLVYLLGWLGWRMLGIRRRR